MWWLDPGKEVLNVLFNRILAPYVVNLDMNQVNYGIGTGKVSLGNLTLKKGALDKFRLPVDVLEGHLGKFTLSLHWLNLGNQPVEILIEDVYLLVVPSPQANVDPEEEEQRAQAAKAERLENAELLHMRGQADESAENSPQSQGMWASLIAKVINNVQVTVKNIHIRYEDKMSVAGHPFAAGVTLAGFTAVSVDDKWEPAFIESTAGAIRKLANLQSLAVYFDTDSPSMAGLPKSEAIQKFTSLISHGDDLSNHQFILKPVSGEGRITVNHKLDKNTPRFDVQLLFDEIGVSLDDNQYRDVISLLDMYHVYVRQHQYRKYRPAEAEFIENRPNALLHYAGKAILETVRERRRKWTWAYLKERRDDRNEYVGLFQKKLMSPLTGVDLVSFQNLEKKLSYEDLRFYRSIARSRLRKDQALRKRLELEQKKRSEQVQTWSNWLWGSSKPESSAEDPTFGGPMTDEQRRQLYDVLDYDEKSAVVESLAPPEDALKARVVAKLKRGTFALKTNPHDNCQNVVSVVFDALQAKLIRRSENVEASVSLGGFGVFDGTTKNTLYPQIVQVKRNRSSRSTSPTMGQTSDKSLDEPFFFVKFEQNPLSKRANNALTVRLRHMEVIYHRGYVEAIFRFFKPPASQLESVEALLNAASQTLEAYRKETRAGLEFALQQHKTIDVQMDMNAPIIIIPEDITTERCKHLVIDAGHIAIRSDLAPESAVREVQSKRSQVLDAEAQRRLNSLMYDKMSLRLADAQFVVGNDLQSCRNALASNNNDILHLLERTNIDLQVQISIVPKNVAFTKFKISGKLPALQVNISDTKYKALMRLIDVCIPHFDDESQEQVVMLPPPATTVSGGFQLPPLFRQGESEYNVEEDRDDDEGDEDQFFEAEDGSSQFLELRQHIFELNFQVDSLRASISKTHNDGNERPLGGLTLERFALDFALAKFDMEVNVKLRSLSMNLVQPGQEPIKFASSSQSDSQSDNDLLTVQYKRAQRASPFFLSVFDGIDQSVDVKISTFIFRAAPEPVISLYDFVMTTFVPQQNVKSVEIPGDRIGTQQQPSPVSNEKIRVDLKLDSVQVILVNGTSSLATLSFSTADVHILLHANTMAISGKLNSLALSNDSKSPAVLPDFNQIMSIEGQDFAEFRYQTFNPNAETYTGIKSSVYLNVGSIKFHFLEHPLHGIYLFLVKLAKLKGLYDAATQVAIQSASEIERMQFDVTVKSPIVVFPSDPMRFQDVLIMRLGEINAKNTSEAVVNKVVASLRGIQLVSKFYYEEEPSLLRIIDDIDVTADIIQTSGIDRSQDNDYPDTQIAVRITDVKLHLTQVQYGLLMGLLQSIPRVLAGAPEGNAQAESVISKHSSSDSSPGPEEPMLVDLEPELRMIPSVNGSRSWTSVDMVISVDVVKLHLYDCSATMESNLKAHGIARFALNRSTLRLKMLSDGAGEAQVVLKSFTMGNTRPGNSKFREIIPAAQHDRNQFMLLYTVSGGANSSALAILTVDSPQVIFAIDPVFALLQFFTSVSAGNQPTSITDGYVAQSDQVPGTAQKSAVDFRVDLHDVSVSVLDNDANSESQAIKLTINQILLSQQGIIALTINHLGMSLIRMGEIAEDVRFLDDFDLTFSLDSRTSSSQQMTSIEITTKPIVFRASYRDINLITTIVNKAIELYGNSQRPTLPAQEGVEKSLTSKPVSHQRSKPSVSTSSKSGPQPMGKARVLMSKEQLKGSFDGFRLVLIGDMHEQPMLHLKVKPFNVGAKDWSGDLQATTTLATHISYWNLTNSHWEPFIDPWTFTVSIAKDATSGGINATLSSRERLDLNVSTTFAELFITTANMWGKEGERVLQKARGSYAPYRIRNRTGSPIFIWSDIDGSSNARDGTAVKISNDQTIDWRFDDWKTMREHVSSSGQHSIGVQFVGKPWEQLRSVQVDREGEYTFSLRPRIEKYSNRLLCEVKVQDNVKTVTIRSTYKIENQTLYPLELTLVDEVGHPVYSLEKIAPGQDFSLPIEAVTQNRIRLQPDQGFGYKWCPAIRWEDLIAKKSFTIKCPHTDSREAAFRFQAWVQTDANDSITRKYPKITLKLRAPLELENLLPYNIQYRIYDKDTDQNWRSYLRKGGIMPVHSVELGHLVLLNVEIQDTVFKPSDFAIINTDGHSDFDIENRLTLRDPNDRKLDLKLNYMKYPDSGGAFKVQIYSPYLVINKTSLPFAVKSTRSTRATPPQDVAGDTREDTLSKPTPFMLSHPQDKGHEYVFKLGDSCWSKLVSLEAPAAETELVIPSQTQKAEEIHVGLSWTEGLGKYKLTKVITLAPRFLIKNNLTETISIRELRVVPRENSLIEPNERRPLHFLRTGREKLLTIAFSGLDAQWSPPINIEDIGTVHLRLRSPGVSGIHLVCADVKINGSTIFVSFSYADQKWPFTIENESDQKVTICQTDAREDADPSTKTKVKYLLNPRSSMQYAWDYPAAREKKIMLTIDKSERTVDILEIGDLVPFRFQSGSRNGVVSLDVRADGHRQILSITNYNPAQSLYKPKNQTTGITRQETISSNSEAFEAVAEEVPPSLTFNLELAGIGMSLINRKMMEVVYLTIDSLRFQYTNSAIAQAVNLSCGTLQIDNQLHDAIYPVILQPTPVAKESNGVAALPTVQSSVIWLKDQAHGVLFIKYFSILLQALTIEADEDLLFAIYDLTQVKGVSWEEGTEDLLIPQAEGIPEPEGIAVGQDLYFEILELQPIRLSLSFVRTERVSSDDKLSIRNPLAVVVNALTMAVGNVNDAPLQLNALAIKDMRLTLPEVQSRITYHYRQDVLRQLYRILGSADFIGNPVGLFTNVSSGVADIFYEPLNGVVMHGNKELGIGIAKGAASFVKKTVFGLSDSMTKFTSSVGKGLSAATFDSEYQNRRRMTQRRNRPRHAIYGVTAGGEALASSVASAMEGVLMKPIEGAESEGAFGFFKGVGKGLVGAVTKPVVGVFDLASNVSEGIRNTTTVFDSPERDRIRLPRHVPADGVLSPYSAREALGQYWMKDLDNGVYRRDSYVAHINSPGGDNVVLLTVSRVISFWSKKLRLDWELPFTNVQGVTVEDTGIRFAHKSGKTQDKFVLIPDKSSQSWFFAQVATVVKSFNARRRMDM